MPQATDSIWLDVLPSMRNFGKELEKGAASEADKSGKNIGQRFGKAMLAGMAVIGGGAVLATKALYSIGSTFDDVSDTIRVGTGATGAALKDLEQSAKNVGTTVPAEFGDVANAVADLNTRLGLTGRPLEEMSTQFLNLSRITGTDLQSNIADMTRVFGDWAISAEDQSETLDRIYRAAQASGAGVDQLAKQVVAFGGSLRGMGFTLDESVALFAKFEKEGVNAELVIGALRQGLGRMAKEGEDAPETFRRVVDEISKMESRTEATAAAMELFGARAGPDMAAAIQEGRFELDEMLSAITDGSDTINGAADDTADFAEQWQIFKNRVLVALEPIATRVFGFLGDAMESFNAWWATNGPGIMDHVGRIRDSIAGFIDRVGPPISDFVTGTLRDLGNWWDDNRRTIVTAVERIRDGLETAFDKIIGAVDFVVEHWDQFRRAIIVGVALIAPHFAALAMAATVSAVKQAAAWLIAQAGAIRAVAVHSAQVAFMVARWVFVGAQSLLHAGRVAAAWLIAMGPIALVVAAVVGLVAAIIIHWDTIKSTIAAAWEWVRRNAVEKWNEITGWLGRTWDSAKEKAVSVFEGMASAIESVWDKIREYALKPVQFVIDTVLNNGLIRAFNWIADKVPGVGKIANIPVPGMGSAARGTGIGGATTLGRQFAEGGYTGPGHKLQPAGIVHADEYVIRADSRRRIETLAPGLLDFMNQYGKMPGYDIGGRVRDLWDATGGRLATGAKDFIIGGLRKAAEKLVNPLIDRIPAGGLVGDVVKGVARKLADAVFSWAGGEDAKASNLAGSTTGLNPEFLRRFRMYSDAVGGLRIVSGFRSSAQQAILYNRWLNRVPGQAPAAPPGRSNHERGLAIDHAPHSTARMRAIAAQYGLRYPMSYEPWHVEPAKYDRGGYLMPGFTFAQNNTGHPERVLTAGQERALGRALEGNGGGAMTVNIHAQRDSAAEIRRTFERWHWLEGARG